MESSFSGFTVHTLPIVHLLPMQSTLSKENQDKITASVINCKDQGHKTQAYRSD